MAMERGNGRQNLGAISIVVPRSRMFMQNVADQHHWGASAWEIGRAVFWLFGGRKILPMLLDFFLEDIRNLKGKVDVFCFVYRASTATFML